MSRVPQVGATNLMAPPTACSTSLPLICGLPCPKNPRTSAFGFPACYEAALHSILSTESYSRALVDQERLTHCSAGLAATVNIENIQPTKAKK